MRTISEVSIQNYCTVIVAGIAEGQPPPKSQANYVVFEQRHVKKDTESNSHKIIASKMRF